MFTDEQLLTRARSAICFIKNLEFSHIIVDDSVPDLWTSTLCRLSTSAPAMSTTPPTTTADSWGSLMSRTPYVQVAGSNSMPLILCLQDALFFQDSLLDVITSLGAEEEKIILSGSAMGNKFNLLDAHRNTPGSASVGASTAVTYQQAKNLYILPIYIYLLWILSFMSITQLL